VIGIIRRSSRYIFLQSAWSSVLLRMMGTEFSNGEFLKFVFYRPNNLA
jgi:hypothetical protein